MNGLGSDDIQAIWLTLRLAVVTTIILLIICTPLAWWLSQTKSKSKIFIQPIVGLPLVLPPTVLGFYLLFFFGAESPLGINFAFSFSGLVLGSVIYSLPFVVQPLQNSFESIGKRPLEVASLLGASPFDQFCTIIFPLAKPGFLTAAILGFAHTLGEFGVVLMIGGNIPGKTQVLSISIYDHVEALNYSKAHQLSLGVIILSFVLLSLVYSLNKQHRRIYR